MRRTCPVVLLMSLTVAIVVALVPGSSAAAAAGEPQLQFGPVPSVLEGGPGTSVTVTVAVSLSAPSPSTSSWRWMTFNQPDFIDDVLPTTPDVDYVATGGTVTFAPGETSGHISVTVLGDALHETTEFIALVAVRDTDPIDFGSVAVGSIHIVDDDLPPTVLPGVAWSTEADGPGAMLHVPVTLSAPSGLDVVVPWTTLDVIGAPPFEARPPGDYTASSGTVVFSSSGSVTRAVVDIPIHDDALPEPDEYVVVSFHDPSGATMGGFWGLGFGGIHDDD